MKFNGINTGTSYNGIVNLKIVCIYDKPVVTGTENNRVIAKIGFWMIKIYDIITATRRNRIIPTKI